MSQHPAPLLLVPRHSLDDSSHHRILPPTPLDVQGFQQYPHRTPSTTMSRGRALVLVGGGLLLISALAALGGHDGLAAARTAAQASAAKLKAYLPVGATKQLHFEPPATRKEKFERLYGMSEWAGRSWLDHIDLLPDEVIDLTGFDEHKHGLGSIVHYVGVALMQAMDDERVLMWGERALGREFVAEDCLADGIRSLDCIFEPLSTCPRSSLTKENTVFKCADKDRIPVVFAEDLEEAVPFPLTAPAAKLWWRGQSASYLTRLRRESLELISSHRLSDEHVAFATSIDKKAENIDIEFPFPLHKGTISIHVRPTAKRKGAAELEQ
ncbi:hypothetical protein MNV49_006023 [Pseudohyphozyma bogoriensis]|nr:hypothetical protein MNV49_006023 [Pseudohyphozyma bogoriensis]